MWMHCHSAWQDNISHILAQVNTWGYLILNSQRRKWEPLCPVCDRHKELGRQMKLLGLVKVERHALLTSTGCSLSLSLSKCGLGWRGCGIVKAYSVGSARFLWKGPPLSEGGEGVRLLDKSMEGLYLKSLRTTGIESLKCEGAPWAQCSNCDGSAKIERPANTVEAWEGSGIPDYTCARGHMSQKPHTIACSCN